MNSKDATSILIRINAMNELADMLADIEPDLSQKIYDVWKECDKKLVDKIMEGNHDTGKINR